MPVGLPLNFEALLAPLKGSAPGGSSSAFFELRPTLEELRREVTPETKATEEDEIKYADWEGIESRTREALAESCKDIRVAAYLIEALVKRYRFAGLKYGLELIRRMFEECWDYLLPVIEDNDLSARASPVSNMLDSPDRGLRLPTAVRLVPMINGAGLSLSCLDWNRSVDVQNSSQKEREALQQAFNKAIPAVKPEAVTADATVLSACKAELQELIKTLDERLGHEAPALLELGKAVEECQRVAGFVLQKVGPSRPEAVSNPDTPSSETDATPETALETAALPGGGRGLSREVLYQQLDRLAEQLQRLEPHSPIPYLIRRAVKLGSMPFPTLLRELLRDNAALGELTREFGLPEES